MLNEKTKETIDEILVSKIDKELLLLAIDKIIKKTPKMMGLKGWEKHWGLCSIIEYVLYTDSNFEDLEKHNIDKIIQSVPGAWEVVSNEGYEVREIENGPFMWQPGESAPRIEFLREVVEYILKNKKKWGKK